MLPKETRAHVAEAAIVDGLIVMAVVMASFADEPDCARGNRAACFGRDMGFAGAVMGLPGAVVYGATALGLIADTATSAANIAGLALGAGGFQAGTFGTTVDIANAITDDGKR